MTDTLTDFDFTGAMGGAAAEAAAASQGRSFNRTGYLKLDGSPQGKASGDDTAIIRMLSDHVARPEGDPRAHPKGSIYGVPWITVDMHSMVPTKPQPSDWPEGRTWPRSMSSVCRNDKVFRARFGDCFIDANLKKEVRGKAVPFPANPRTWALAVLREEVIGDGSDALGGEAWKGQVVGIRDKTKEVAKIVDGKVVEGEGEVVPDVVVLTYAWKNFFGQIAGMAARYHTILDRDLHITRSGNDQSTIYQIVPLDPIQMADGTVYDLSRPDLITKIYPDLPDLRLMVAEQASDDYYARFFDTTKVSPPIKKEGETAQAPATQAPAGPAQVPAAPNTEPSTDALAALRNRVQGAPPAAAPPAAPATPAETPAAPESAAAPAEAPAPPVTPPAPAVPAGRPGGLAL